MGRKVHPYGFRLGVIRDWKSHWYAEGEEYADLLHEDLEIRKYIRDTMGRAGISRIEGKNVSVDVQEVEQPDLGAKLVAESIVSQLERRISHNRAMKRAVQAALRAGAHGIKIACKGRLFGAEMAREQWQREGRVPLQTLRADIDYAQEEAHTTYGRIGVKGWIYKGEVLPGLPETGQAENPFAI